MLGNQRMSATFWPQAHHGDHEAGAEEEGPAQQRVRGGQEAAQAASVRRGAGARGLPCLAGLGAPASVCPG